MTFVQVMLVKQAEKCPVLYLPVNKLLLVFSINSTFFCSIQTFNLNDSSSCFLAHKEKNESAIIVAIIELTQYKSLISYETHSMGVVILTGAG